jgi:hypothetical protein
MSNDGAAPRAAVPVSSARAEASRKNGAKSRGPRSPEGKARSAQNALRHGMRALQYVVLPDEDAVQFQALEAALLDELAPEGALQLVLARRVAVAAWRLARADRMEVELFEERRWEDAGVGMALIRDGNGTRSFETLLRYRSAAMAEFWRALKTLKALQAEPAAVLEQAAGADLVRETPATQLAAPAPMHVQSSRAGRRLEDADHRGPNEPERLMAYLLPEPPSAGPALHEPAASAPNEPETGLRSADVMTAQSGPALQEPAAPWTPNEPEPALALPPAPALPVAHGDRAAGRATVGKLTPSAAGGVGAVIERQDIDGLLAELRARAGPASS